MKTVKLYSAVVCLAVAMAGIGSVSAETLEFLTWKGYAPKALVDKFQQETGIEVKVTYSNNEEMIAKLRATRGAGRQSPPGTSTCHPPTSRQMDIAP